MDGMISFDKIKQNWKKYRYAIGILAVGVILMMIPKQETTFEEVQVTAKSDYVESVSAQLSALLSKMDGAGKVEVLLTYSCGEETIYQINEKTTGSSGADSSSVDTVIISDAQRSEYGLVKQVNPAKCLGAIILCQGAESPALRYSIIEAVSKATGLGTDKISVLKMK